MFKDSFLGAKIRWKIKKAFIIKVRIMVPIVEGRGLQLEKGLQEIFWVSLVVQFGGNVYTGDHCVLNHQM